MFGWIWPSGSGEEVKIVNTLYEQTDGQWTGDQKSSLEPLMVYKLFRKCMTSTKSVEEINIQNKNLMYKSNTKITLKNTFGV